MSVILAGLSFAWGGIAHGGTTVINLQGGANWQSTTDGLLATQWNNGNVTPGDGGIPAFSPYSNSATTTLNQNSMMWYCALDTAGCLDQAENGSGPVEAFFVRQFAIKDGAEISGAFAIIADDFVRLNINGQFVMDALLDDNTDANGQPLPLIFDIHGFDLSLRTGNALDLGTLAGVLSYGTNTFVLQAMDGNLINGGFSVDDCADRNGTVRQIPGGRSFCSSDRLFEYAFIQGSMLAVLPEPTTLALLGSALAGLAIRRRSKSA
ncbi:MAG: PEP-CTERM sorting domain-containing protein [Candidatus Accumulibacter sp. UW26]